MEMRIKTYVFFLCFFISLISRAQVGREFWFVAPEVIHAHGDQPVFFRITTFDQPTRVTISSPANPSFNTLTVDIPANTQYTTPENAFDINHIENRPSNVVNNKGILITSTDADVSVYYEVASSANPDKFTLKGNNALGVEFFVPSQNTYQNQSKYYDPDPSEKVDLVATEDGTEIIIVPTVDVVGHRAGDTIRITLNRGQTFCVENTNPYYKSSLAGTYILADKPIAVTISDDSLNERLDFWGAYDLIGDQLIPTSVLGCDYAIVNTSTDGLPGVRGNTINKVFVLAIADNTNIKINGNKSLEKTLQKGKQIDIDITDNNMFLSATKPVYVYQLASLHYGGGNEMGSSLLPHISCTGSDVVSFKRIFSDRFFLQLLVQGKARNSFIIEDHNGIAQNYLNAVPWVEIKGTNKGNADEAWYTANIDLSYEIGTTNPYFVKNTKGLFHLSILEENGSSASYGYFSSFSNLTVNGVTESCKGNKIKLSTDEPMKSYRWFSDQTGNAILSEGRDLFVDQSGKYWVTAEVEHGGCMLTDTIDVVFVQPKIDLGADAVVCPGTVLDFEGTDASLTYAWSNGDSGIKTSVAVIENFSEKLSVHVTDADGCTNEDTVRIDAVAVPEIILDKLEICKGENVTVTTPALFSGYEWTYNGSVLNVDPTQNYIQPQESGIYEVTCLTAQGCNVSESFQIIVNNPVVVQLNDVTTCYGETARVEGPVNSLYTYLWSDGSTNAYTDLLSEGTFWLEVTDDNGCLSRAEANLSYIQPLSIDLGPDRNECDEALLTVAGYEKYSEFKWTFDDGTTETSIIGNPAEYQYRVVNSGGLTDGTYKIEARDINGCVTRDSVNVSFIQVVPPELSVDRKLCVGETVTITASNGYNNYRWFLDGIGLPQFNNMSSIQVDQPGEYTLEANYLKCTTGNSISIHQYGLPTVELPVDMSFCPGEETVLTVSNVGQSADGGKFDYLYWNANNNMHFTDWTVASHTVNQPGTYTVTVVDEYGCKATDEIVVSEYDLTPINLGGTLSACADAGVTLHNNVAGTQSYEWYRAVAGSELMIADNTDYLAVQSGTYKLAIIDANGCKNSANVDVVINPLPEFSLVDAIVCPGSTHRFEGPVESGYQYTWSDGSVNSFLETSVIGEYSLEVVDANGCKASEAVLLNNFVPIPIDLGNDRQECVGINLNIRASANHSNYSWELNGNSLVQPSPDEHIYQVVNAQVLNSGFYKAIAEDVNGCVVEDEVKVDFIQADELELFQTENLCRGESIDILASDLYDTYKWSFEGVYMPEFDDAMLASVSQSGRYTVEASVDGCKKTNHIDVEMNELPSVQLPDDYSVCPEAEITIANVKFTPSTDGYAFDYLYWDNNENVRNLDWQNASYEVASPGSYSVTVVDKAGCKATDQINISEHAVTPPELNGPYTACSNIGVTLQNPLSNSLSYSWYKIVSGTEVNVAKDEDYLVEESGRYKLSVVDVNGCESDDETDVTINQIPSFNINDAIVCPGVVHRFEGPLDPTYSYAWSDGSSDSFLETSQTGIYNLTVTDNVTNCVAEGSMKLSNYTPVEFDLGSDLSVCVQSNLTISSIPGFNGYVWKFNDGTNPEIDLPGQIPESEYQIINAQTTESGTYLVEAFDINGCAVADQVDVEVVDIGVPALSLSKYLCQGQTVDIYASAGYDAYTWSKDGSIINGTNDQSTVQVSEGGVYSVEVELFGCSKTNAVDVTSYALPGVKLPQDFSICPGADATLRVDNYIKGCAENEFKYLYWNDADSQRYGSWQNAKYDLSSPGEYSVTVVDTLGCTATDNIIITENVVTPLDLPETLTNCENTGQLLTNNETNYRNYSWFKLSNTGEQLLAEDGDYRAMEAGSYKLRLTDANGCEKSDTVVIKLNPAPNVDLGEDRSLCEMEYLVVTPGSNYTSYRWNDDDTNDTNELQITSSGKYKVEVSNVYGCMSSDSVNITVNQAPDFDLGQDVIICPGTSYLLNGPAGDYRYMWSGGEKSRDIEVEKGNYVLQVTDKNGCTGIDSIRVANYPAPVVDLGDDEIICPVEGSVVLNAGDGFASYLWHNGAVSSQIVAELADTVNFVTVTDANNCRGFDTKMVKYLPQPEVELLSDTSICSVDSCLLTAGWDYNDVLWSTGVSYPEIWVKDAGEYWLKASDGCFWLSDTMQLNINPTPVVARLDTSIYAQVVLYPQGGTEPYRYSLNNDYFQDENVFRNLANGDHVITVEDTNGCATTDTITINDNLNLEIPEFFTPNGDGINDSWIIKGIDKLPESEIGIYDRYGKLLVKYKASDQGWDGKYLGKMVRSDDYWYVIKLNPVNKIIKGNLSLKR